MEYIRIQRKVFRRIWMLNSTVVKCKPRVQNIFFFLPLITTGGWGVGRSCYYSSMQTSRGELLFRHRALWYFLLGIFMRVTKIKNDPYPIRTAPKKDRTPERSFSIVKIWMFALLKILLVLGKRFPLQKLKSRIQTVIYFDLFMRPTSEW